MHRPLISFFLIILVAVVALLASGMIEVQIDVHDKEGNPIRRKAKHSQKEIDEIFEAEVVDEGDKKN